jgi:outer membrane protein assembly factor BamB
MIKRKCLIVVLLFAALSISQGFLEAKELKKVSLEEVLSIGRLDDDTLFQWAGVAVDPRGNIYLSDAMDYSLKRFDSQGNLIKKAGGKGQGPGEFMAPRLLDCSENYLYATDQNFRGLKVFDRELNFVRNIMIKMLVSDLKILSDSEIAVTSLPMFEKPAVFIFDQEGKLTREIKYSDKDSSLLMDVVSFDLDEERNLYLAYNFQDRIEKWSITGKKLWSINLLKVKKVKKKKVSSFVVPTELVFKDVAVDGEGNLFVLGGHFSKNSSRDVYVLNSEGNHLATFTLPDSSHCIYIDGKNFLYSRANEGVTLKKFRMRYVYH